MTSDHEGQGHGETGAPGSGADGDEFDAIQRRIAAMRREAMDRIEAVRRPRPGEPARPTITPPSSDRPAPPRVSVPAPPVAPAVPTAAPTVAPTPTPAPVPEPAPSPAPERSQPTEDTHGAEWRWDRIRDRTAPAPAPITGASPPPVEEPVPNAPVAPADTDASSSATPVVGSVIRVSELPMPDLVDVDVDARGTVSGLMRGDREGGRGRVGLTTNARELVERIAVTRSVAVLGWQAFSVVILIATIAWIAWFPFAAGGSGARALVVSDGRMAPTIMRGDVVVVRSSPDLPYPVGTVVALQQGGSLVTERIVGEERTDAGRILFTRSDGVSVGADRRVAPQEIIGSVRRIHRMVGYPVLWFTSSSTPLPGLLAILVVLSSVLGTAALVVRWDLKRSDRALVSAIASGTRTPPQH